MVVDPLADVRDQHPFDLRANPGVDEVHQLRQQQGDRPRRQKHRERDDRARQRADQTILSGKQRPLQIPYPA